MKITLNIGGKNYHVDTDLPLDISIALQSGVENPNAWYIPPPIIEAEYNEEEEWVGSVAEGGPVNFNHISFNPHAHGTHTECVGHITAEKNNILDSLKTAHFVAELISVAPIKVGEDRQINKEQLEEYAEELEGKDAIVIRTVPNSDIKKTQQYNHTNWPYLTEEAAAYIASLNIQHLLIDLPSVDKERDNGALVAHRAFWQFPENTRKQATITELIYVPDQIIDGTYLLNLQIAPFVNDASPSRPVLYALNNK